jgi:hypothetical protein
MSDTVVLWQLQLPNSGTSHPGPEVSQMTKKAVTALMAMDC